MISPSATAIAAKFQNVTRAPPSRSASRPADRTDQRSEQRADERHGGGLQRAAPELVLQHEPEREAVADE
jgi:hypothetical protein